MEDSFTTRSTTDMLKTTANTWKVYVQNQLITVENAENQLIKIIDITGRIWVNKAAASSVERFYIATKGVYIVTVGSKSQKVFVP